MKTVRFDICRQNKLGEILKKDEMIRIWKKEIRNNFRRSVLEDFHDYSDFQIEIDKQIENIIANVMAGNYRVKPPLWYKEEKKLGISRLLLLPSPDDAILMQTITDNFITKDIGDIQPVANVFFSQLRHANKPQIHEIKNENGYSRSKLFEKFRKVSLGFAGKGNFVVTTDLSNFFDSVILLDLRHVVSHWFTHHEVELDLLFKIIETYNFTPDYLPTRGRGLPTIDLDAPRFLAHVYLFEVDQIMSQLTNKNYTRWMDDIVFGAKNYSEAREILGKLNDVLRSRGLSLNLQKTQIHSSSDYYKSVMFNDNVYLDRTIKEIEDGKFTKSKKRKFEQKWKLLLKLQNRPRVWEKIIKRFISACLKANSYFILNNFDEIFFECPSARGILCDLLSRAGYSKFRAEQVKKVLKSKHFFEDTALTHLVASLCKWNIPYTNEGRNFVKVLDKQLTSFNSELGKYSCLYFKTIHCDRKSLFEYISKHQAEIKKDGFLARQIICCFPLIWNENPKWCELKINEMALDTSSGNSILAQRILNLIKDKNIDLKKTKEYFFYNLKGAPLKHSKLILLIAYLVNPERSEIVSDLFCMTLDNIKKENQLDLILRSIED